MKTTQEFIESMVNVEYIDNEECFGHYPFQMISINKEEKTELAAMFLGGDVIAVYKAFGEKIEQGAVTVMMSCDFPAVADIKKDFVAVFTYQDGALSSLAIPYDPETGKTFDQLTETKAMKMLEQNLKAFAKIN